jgi:hypothetical protein
MSGRSTFQALLSSGTSSSVNADLKAELYLHQGDVGAFLCGQQAMVCAVAVFQTRGCHDG